MQFLVKVNFGPSEFDPTEDEIISYVTEAEYASEAECAIIDCLMNEGEDEASIHDVEAFPFDQFEHGDYYDYARV